MGDAAAAEPSSGDPVLDEKRKEYRYVYDKLAPAKIPMVASLPESEKASTAYMIKWMGMAGRMVMGNALPGSIRWLLRKANPVYWRLLRRNVRQLRESEQGHRFPGVRVPTTYALLWQKDPPSPVIRTWNLDHEFARQRLAGIDPTVIRNVPNFEHLPSKRLIPSQDLLDRILGRQKGEPRIDIDDLAAAGKLYCCDYRDRLENLPLRKKRYMAAPYALFAWRESRYNDPARLMPLSIQLERDGHVFFPDQGDAWMVAKYWVQSADAVHGDMWSHLVHSHLCASAFVISTHRHLPPGHPIFEVLVPHFQFTLRVNEQFPGFFAQSAYNSSMPYTKEGRRQLIQRAYDAWDFTKNSIDHDLEHRGVLSDRGLPNYPYRDDLLTLWEPVRKFADKYVHAFYDSDDAVRKDKRLQSWHTELVAPIGSGGNVKGLPKPEDRKTLAFIVGEMIMHFGPKHAAVHSPAADMAIFGPNAATFLTQPIPGDEKSALAPFRYYPNLGAAFSSFMLHYAISNIHFGQFNTHGDGMQRVGLDLANRLQKDLVDAEEELRARNERRYAELRMRYPYLEPSSVPNSIFA